MLWLPEDLGMNELPAVVFLYIFGEIEGVVAADIVIDCPEQDHADHLQCAIS